MLKQKKFLVLIVFALTALVLAACGGNAPAESANAGTDNLSKNSDGYTDINAEQLAGMMENKDFTLVNVHVPYAGDIPQTDVSIPFDQVAANPDQLPADKDAPVVVYCRSGSMSTQAAKELAGLGYTNIMELDGGMNGWRSAGNQLENTQ